MLQSFYIFNKAGVLMFHQQIAPKNAGAENVTDTRDRAVVNKASGRKIAPIATSGVVPSRGALPDPKLVGAFLSAASSWAEMYSQSGVALFMTGSTKFIFDQSHYTSEMIFCIASTKDHDDADLHEKMDMVLENFVHFFWEDRGAMTKGVISPEKIEQFRDIVKGFLA
ncbi:MAG: hypothetical protein GYA24_10305 [Candidatus Lokiarchaeota archaeon]|nr:hypothetical protein [Candidatus Lokiarchaeota archaeon]